MASQKLEPVEIDCYAVRRELVNYMEADLTAEFRARIDYHLRNCAHCKAVYDGVRNVVRLLGDKDPIELPERLSQRLYQRFVFRVE